jgi:ATPase subunit of ABC transporter with duplicated ATPase domains
MLERSHTLAGTKIGILGKGGAGKSTVLESKQALPEVQAVIDELERAVVYHG